MFGRMGRLQFGVYSDYLVIFDFLGNCWIYSWVLFYFRSQWYQFLFLIKIKVLLRF